MRVIVEVSGGIAYLVQKPSGVEVEIIDHDCSVMVDGKQRSQSELFKSDEEVFKK
jgi:hypothetical protein